MYIVNCKEKEFERIKKAFMPWYVVVTPTPKKCSQEKEFLRFGFFSRLLVAHGCANYFFICFYIVLCHFSVISSYSKGRSLEGSRSLSAIFLSFHTSIAPCSFLENVVLNPSMLLLLLYVSSSSRVSRCWLGRFPVVQNTAAAAGARLGVEATVGAFVCLFDCWQTLWSWISVLRLILEQQASHGCEGGEAHLAGQYGAGHGSGLSLLWPLKLSRIIMQSPPQMCTLCKQWFLKITEFWLICSSISENKI